MSSSSGSVVSDVTDVPDTMDLKEKERLTAVAKAMTEDLLMATDLLGGIPWSLVHEKHGISLFRADVANDVPCNVHAVYKFNSDIEDVAKSMITNTTESYKSMMRMLSSDFLDGAVVQTIVEPTEQNPYRYVALKWAAFKSSSRFGKDRDFIILEYVDMIEDDQGQKIAFRIMESVDVPNNSPYADSAKYSRDIVPLMGFMYHTTKKPGELRLTYSCNFDKNGDLPAWAANSAIQQHVEMCVTGIAKYIENFRAQKEEIVLPQQVIPMREKQDCCHMCEKKFCMVRRKYNCLKCGEVICSNCSSVRTTIVPDVGERQLRVCTGCVIAVRRSSKTPVPPEGGLGLGSVASPASRAASTVTVDTDVASIRCGSSNHGNASICRTQSFNSQGKRRSLDDVLDPVRSRLIEYKTFSDSAEAVQIPKASFPTRSFSDGIIKGGTLFHAKRRGSPADLAISIEAFRQHQSRMGNADDASSHDSSESDEETMEQLQYLSTSSTSTGSPSSQNSSVSPPARERFPAAEPFSPLASRDKQRQRVRGRQDRRKTATVDYSSYEELYAVPGVNDDSRCRFKEAAERAPDLIDQAKSTHHLAQHVRRKVHHRVAALRMEEQDDSGIPDNQDPHHQPQITYTSYSPSSQTEIECNISIIPPARVRRAVCQTKNGTVLYGRKPAAASLEMEVDQQIQLLSRGLAEVHPSNQSVDAHYRRQPQHGSSRYY